MFLGSGSDLLQSLGPCQVAKPRWRRFDATVNAKKRAKAKSVPSATGRPRALQRCKPGKEEQKMHRTALASWNGCNFKSSVGSCGRATTLRETPSRWIGTHGAVFGVSSFCVLSLFPGFGQSALALGNPAQTASSYCYGHVSSSCSLHSSPGSLSLSLFFLSPSRSLVL